MSDVFISYASEDRDRIRPLVRAFEREGLSVWWDRDIRPGPSYDREIEAAIEAAGCMVVVWSHSAVESEWVRNEVEEGARRGILVPARIDDVLAPLAYRRRQTADLVRDVAGEGYVDLLASVRATLDGELAGSVHARAKNRVPARRSRSLANRWLWLSIAALVVLAAAGWLRPQTSPEVRAVSFDIELPEGIALPDTGESRIAIDRLGETVYVVAREPDGFDAIYARQLVETGFSRVPGTRTKWLNHLGAGHLLGVFAGPTSGEVALALSSGGVEATRGSGSRDRTRLLDTESNERIRLHWAATGAIAYKRANGASLELISGGERQTLAEGDPEELVTTPFFDPGGRVFYYSRGAGEDGFRIYAMSLETRRSNFLANGIFSRITPGGTLLFLRDRRVYGVKLSADRISVLGTERVLLESVETDGFHAQLDVAEDGTLVYQPPAARLRELVWVSRDGTRTPTAVVPHPHFYRLRLSPDGAFAAITGGWDGDVWIASLVDGLVTRVSDTPGLAFEPWWTPDGQHILFTHWPDSTEGQLSRVSRAQPGPPEPLLVGVGNHWARGLTPDGEWLIFETCLEATISCDIGKLRMADPDTRVLLLESPHNEREPVLSPEGRYLAYESDEFGPSRVVIRRFDALLENYWQVPGDGCGEPRFTSGGTELLMRCPGGLFAVTVDLRGEPQIGQPEFLFDDDGLQSWDVTSDGLRFLLLREATPSPHRLRVVLDWGREVDVMLGGGSR